MPNTSRRWKIDYKNSSGNREIIAETGQDTGALKIDRHVHIKRKNDPDMLKVWLDGTDFSAIPTKKTEFGLASNGRDEQEILLKHYNEDTSSFDTVNRFYPKNKGTVDENGNLAWKLYSHMKSTAQETVPSVNNSNDIESALNDVLPSDYDATVPAGASVPSVDNYKLSTNGETDREKGYHELTRNYGYAMTFTSNINGSGNAEVKYEPEGFGGTVDTLVPNEQATTHAIVDVNTGNNTFFVSGDITDSFAVNQSIEVVRSTGNDDTYTIDSLSYDSGENETDIDVKENVGNSTADGLIIPGGQAVFKSWEKEKADEVINKVRVEGTDSNGNTITGTAKNQAQIDNFGERFKKVKVGYVQSTSEAEEIAKNFLKPGKNDSGNDITEVPESGTVRTTVYTDNVVNDSFQVVDNTRNIDDTFTVVEQRNHWPEAISIIEFEFEKENLERAAIDKENLRDERARLYPDENKGLSGQTGNTAPGVGGNTGDTSPGVGGSTGDSSPDVDGDTGDTSPDVDGDTGDTGPDIAGNSGTAGGSSEIQSTSESFSSVNASSGSFSEVGEVDASFSDGEGADLYYSLEVDYDDSPSSFVTPFTTDIVVFDIVVRDETNNKDIPQTDVENRSVHINADSDGDGDGEFWTSDVINGKIHIPDNPSGNDYSLRIKPDEDVIVGGQILLVEYDEHDHDDGTFDADLHPHDDGTLDTDSHPHDDGTLDTDSHPHGDGTLDTDSHPHDDGTLDTDNHPHQNGTLEAEVAQEDKTDR